MHLKTLLILPLILLASCVDPLAQPQPLPKEGLAQIKVAMDDHLVNSKSAEYKNVTGPKLRERSRGMQYLMTYDVRAKNRIGMYGFYTPYLALFEDGKVYIITRNLSKSYTE
ncbi:MAG: hypothetical protein ACSHX0_08705 [Akkermansiaceae bacterium]